MTTLRTPSVLLLLLAGCHSAHPAAGPRPQTLGIQQVLRAAMQRSATAWNAGDIEEHVAMYTDSAEMMTRTGPRGGREVIRGMLQRSFWKDGQPFQQLAFSDLVVTPLGNDFAMMTGAFALSGSDKPPASGRFTLIWKKTPAGWRIIHDHSS